MTAAGTAQATLGILLVAALSSTLLAAEPLAVGIPPGLSCEHAYDAETGSGSKAQLPRSKFLSENGGLFDGALFGQRATRIYLCRDGRVRSQQIQLNYPTEQAAAAVHASVLQTLTRLLGAPCRFPNLLPLPNRQALLAEQPQLAESMRNVAQWSRLGGGSTRLNLAPLGTSGNWQVTVNSDLKTHVCHRD